MAVQDALFSALALRRVGGVPLRSPRSADAVYVQSIFADTPESALPETPDASTRLEEEVKTARRTLLALQRAGLSVWVEGRELEELQMAQEQIRREMEGEVRLAAIDALERVSLAVPGVVAVQRLRDAVAVSDPLGSCYLQDAGGRVLVVDGTESEEEVAEALRMGKVRCASLLRTWGQDFRARHRSDLEETPNAMAQDLHVLAFAVKPRDRLASGVAAARRFAEILTRLNTHQSETPVEDKDKALEPPPRLPILQWLEAPPKELLNHNPEQEDESAKPDAVAGVSQSSAVRFSLSRAVTPTKCVLNPYRQRQGIFRGVAYADDALRRLGRRVASSRPPRRRPRHGHARRGESLRGTKPRVEFASGLSSAKHSDGVHLVPLLRENAL